MHKVLYFIFAVYVGITSYMISGYETVNDNLQKANSMLLRACVPNSVEVKEMSYEK